MSLNSATAAGDELIPTVYSRLPILTVPVGRVTHWAEMALDTSWGLSPYPARASWSRSTMTCRSAPPNGRDRVVPCTLASCWRSWKMAKSYSSAGFRVSLETAICTTGTLDALNRRMRGGTVPLGIRARIDWQTAVSWAWHSATFAPG
jgi:hypothetical protein